MFLLRDQQKRHWPDLLLPEHRRDVDACDLPIRGSSSTVAVAMRHKRHRRWQAKRSSARIRASTPWRRSRVEKAQREVAYCLS